jgi:glyoxalase/bleomycin resistance protein/dioxygenase superfamily protein
MLASRTLLFALAAWPAIAQVPEFYRSVDRVSWVVDNLDRVTLGWEKAGLWRLERRHDVDLPVVFRGAASSAQVRTATGFLGDLRVDWVQPLGGENAFAEFQKKHGSGVFSLVHRVPTLEAYEREIERLRALGVGILQSGERRTGEGVVRYCYFDTEPEGKYVLGLIHLTEGLTEAAPPDGPKIVQFAFAVHDLKPVSAYWAKLGLGAMSFNQGNLSDVHYWGKPIPIQQNFGWQRSRKVPYEWLQPVTSPNIFDDHMNKYGEGIHHIGVNVPDMEKSVAEWSQAGFKVASSGRWGTRDQPGSGRFTYVDTEPIGGVTTELLWQFH